MHLMLVKSNTETAPDNPSAGHSAFKSGSLSQRSNPLQSNVLVDDMGFLNPSPSPPPAPRKGSYPKDDVDDFLSSDLELSFASSMSLHSPAPKWASPVPMDISPAQPQLSGNHLGSIMPRAFGREMLNTYNSPHNAQPPETKSNSRGRQRAALPAQWMMAGVSSDKGEQNPSMFKVEETVPVSSPGDAMDVDVVCSSLHDPTTRENSTPNTASSKVDAGYSNLFYEVPSPQQRPSPVPKKRRSSSPEPYQSPGSSDPPSSPSQQKFTRAATIGVGAPLFKKKPALEYAAPSVGPVQLRRHAISTLVAPTNDPSHSGISQAVDGGYENGPLSAPLPLARRAFSAMVTSVTVADQGSDEVSDIQSSSPAAAYAKRHQARVIRRCDGSDDLRPLASAGSLKRRDRLGLQDSTRNTGCSPRSLAGFGVKEVEGKILPCHRVSEDGLVRITSGTLKDLLNGVYSSKVSIFTIVDCRFDYEFEGGHIPNAVNLNTTMAIEEYFLGSRKPQPCESGDAEACNLLVFHCEFSVKRAPTFAKHLRSKDRALNGRVYPKVCYPEIYILEGGFFQFFKEHPEHCDPQGYVPMDDPAFKMARDTDLDNFRRGKWKRTQSYTYGQTSSSTTRDIPPLLPGVSASSTREHRNTAPSGGPGDSGSIFAAANAARGRRAGSATTKGLSVLEEDTSSSGHEDGDCVQDSPCPPPSKGLSRPGVLSKTKGGRSGLDRAVSYGSNALSWR